MSDSVARIIVKGQVADYALMLAQNKEVEVQELKEILKELSEEIKTLN